MAYIDQLQPIAEIVSTTDATTTSTTDAVISDPGTGANAFSVVLPKGTYEVTFSAEVGANTAGQVIYCSLYSGTTQLAGTLRRVQPIPAGVTLNLLGLILIGNSAAKQSVSITKQVASDGVNAVSARWSTSAGTATVSARTMNFKRTGS